jgi:hypothetical protein
MLTTLNSTANTPVLLFVKTAIKDLFLGGMDRKEPGRSEKWTSWTH